MHVITISFMKRTFIVTVTVVNFRGLYDDDKESSRWNSSLKRSIICSCSLCTLWQFITFSKCKSYDQSEMNFESRDFWKWIQAQFKYLLSIGRVLSCQLSFAFKLETIDIIKYRYRERTFHELAWNNHRVNAILNCIVPWNTYRNMEHKAAAFYS